MAGHETIKHHLAVIDRRYVTPILAGAKRIELRLLRRRGLPWERVQAGDCLWFKAVSGPVVGCATAVQTRWMILDGPDRMAALRRDHGGLIGADESFWADRADARYACLIWLGNPRRCPPLRPIKRDQRSWVVLPGRPFDGMRI